MATDKATPSGPVTTVSAEAMLVMGLHAVQNSTTVVHGALLGTYSNKNAVQVTQAVPICHEAPTKPLIETGLALAATMAKKDAVVVGWYTSPATMDDTAAGPAALRIVAGLANTDEPQQPVLLVINNRVLADSLGQQTTTGSSVLVSAYGKDFGQQWQEPLECTIEEEVKVVEGLGKCVADKDKLQSVGMDLVSHWETQSKDWLASEQQLSALLG